MAHDEPAPHFRHRHRHAGHYAPTKHEDDTKAVLRVPPASGTISLCIPSPHLAYAMFRHSQQNHPPVVEISVGFLSGLRDGSYLTESRHLARRHVQSTTRGV